MLLHHLGQIHREISDQSSDTTIRQQYVGAVDMMTALFRPVSKPILQMALGGGRSCAMVIDGQTLNWALMPELENFFLALAQWCQSVVCCRATPLQKVEHEHVTMMSLFIVHRYAFSVGIS